MTLNLVNKEDSDIDYIIHNFPDGQNNIVLDSSHIYVDRCKIKTRLTSFKDLEILICAVACLKEYDIYDIDLYVSYFLGARSDRKFEEGGNNYLKDVICPIINSLGFKSVTVLDPHSDVLEACIKGFRKESNLELVRFSLNDLCETNLNVFKENIILVSPDAGASKKIYKLAEQIGYKGEIITCSKDRDENGEITRTVMPKLKSMTSDYLIIDDICDGGKTFIEIAKVIKGYYDFKGNIYLIITHGIFSKGLDVLANYFDAIYTTNSYTDIDDDFFIRQLKVI